MAKNDLELQAVVDPRSRSEQYLNHMCGRAQNLGALPKPLSRVEEYLEYLCYNPPQGGGGGQPFNGVTSVTYNQQNKQLTVTYSNLPVQTLDLSNLIDVTDVRFDNNTNKIIVDKNGVTAEYDLSKLNTKINNVNPVDGNIDLALNQAGDEISLTVGGQDFSSISLADYLKDADTTNVGGQPNADKIVKLGADGKLSETMIPDLAITKVEQTNDKTTAEQLATNGQIQVGDVVVLTNDENKVYMYNGNTQGAFEDKFIELSLGDGTIKVINGQRPTNAGSVTVESQHIPYNDNQTNLNANNVQDAIQKLNDKIVNAGGGTVTSVNNQRPQGGNVTVKAEHIDYDDAQINLQATNVQDAIKKLNEKFVSDIEFEDATRTLKKTINGTQTDVVSGIVTKWGDLEDVNEYPYANLLEYNKKVTGFAYTGNGDAWREDSRWSTAFIDVEEGKIYTVFRKHQDSNRFIYTNSVGGRKINADTVNSNWNSNGFNGRAFTIPRGQNITKVAIMFQHGLNAIDEIMVFEGEIREIPGFIPFADKALIQIGTKVSHKFDNEGSNLKSTTLSSAIKEIEIEVNNKVSQDEVTVLSDANKVVRLDGNGKLDLSVIPNFSINRVHPVLDEQKALELIDNNTAQVGDIFILTNRNNSVYMYVNENGIDFDNKCVELTMTDGTVKSVNGVFADDTGNVTIGIDNIATLRNELNLRLKSINGQTGVDGNVDLSCENTNEKIDFKVKNEIFATITYITDNQVQEIKDLFTF